MTGVLSPADFDMRYGDTRLPVRAGKEQRVLVVCHCFRVDDSVSRIISARKADRKEAGTCKDYRG